MFPGIGALLGSNRNQSSPPALPYEQQKQYSSVAQASSHAITFPATPTSGHLLLIFACTDKGAMSTPAGWTQDVIKTAGTLNLVAFKKISAGTETTTTITCTASIMAAVAYEFVLPGSNTGAVDDNGVVLLDQSILTNDIFNAITGNAVDLIFAVACFFNTAHIDTGDGPYSFDNSFANQGYALAPHSGTSGVSIEIVIGYRKSTTTGTYHSNVTSTLTEAATSPPAFIVAFK